MCNLTFLSFCKLFLNGGRKAKKINVIKYVLLVLWGVYTAIQLLDISLNKYFFKFTKTEIIP